jgi:hypothetical protein
VLFGGLSMFFQKVMWFFVPPLVIASFLMHKESRLLLPLVVVPVLAWIIGGAFYHDDYLWFMRWSVENLLTSRSALPIFDGIVTPLISGSISKVVKGSVILLIFSVVLVCLYYSVRCKAWAGACIAISFMAMITIVNSYEIWVVGRYSKLLIIPIASIYMHSKLDSSGEANGGLFPIAVIVFLASNFAFGYYMARVYLVNC